MPTTNQPTGDIMCKHGNWLTLCRGCKMDEMIANSRKNLSPEELETVEFGERYGEDAIKLKKVVESMYKALKTCRTSKFREDYNGQGYIKTEQDYNKALVEEAIKQYEEIKNDDSRRIRRSSTIV